MIHSMTCALSRIPTYPRQMTSAYNVAEYFVIFITFDCALSGPFDKLFLTRLSAPRALCKGIIAVISASTVWCTKLWGVISRKLFAVNRCSINVTEIHGKFIVSERENGSVARRNLLRREKTTGQPEYNWIAVIVNEKADFGKKIIRAKMNFVRIKICGGDWRARTADLLRVKQALWPAELSLRIHIE